MAIIQVRVTDRNYKLDCIEVRYQTGFLSCIGNYGDIFGYNNTMWLCCALGINSDNWHSCLVNTHPSRLEITFTHGVPARGDSGVHPTRLEVYEKHRRTGGGHGRRRTWRRQLVNYARLYNANHLLIRLQRWFRRVPEQWRARRLVLAMALHPRLGCDSGLGALGEDILRLLT